MGESNETTSDQGQEVKIPQNIVDAFNESQDKWHPIIEEYLPELTDIFLTPENFNTILDLVQEETEETEGEMYEWELGSISKILGKILIPDSIRPTLENAKKLAREVVVDDNLDIKLLDVCAGAGIGSIMNWLEMKKMYPNKPCTIFAVDDAPESIQVAKTYLTLKGIPIKVTELEKIEEVNGFDGIVLIESEAMKAVDKFIEFEKQFNAVYSDHGIGYFDTKAHKGIVEKITKNLLDREGIFLVCSLENNVSVSLSYGKMISQILTNKHLMETIPNENSPYDLTEKDESAIVTAMNTKDTAALYSILQNFLKGCHFNDFIKYIKAIGSVAKTTKNLAREVDSSIEYTQQVLEDMGKESIIVPSYQDRKYSIARTLWYYN